MEKNIKIAAFTGSLRKDSYNKKALRAAAQLIPDGTDFEILDISQIPFYNEDVEKAGSVPEVEAFKNKLDEADAIFISTPEYNYSLPPVLKNALDWASRGHHKPLYGKPLAIISASPGIFGGVRAQYHLRQICVSLNLLPINKPEVFIMKAGEKFDETGRLIDEHSRESIKKLLQGLVDRAGELKGK